MFSVFLNFKNNLKFIFKKFKYIFLFFICLILVAFVNFIQIYICFIFLLYYTIFVFIYKFIKIPIDISCEEKETDLRYIINYSIINIFLFVPQSYSFYFLYQFLYFFKNFKTIFIKFKKSINFYFFLGIMISFFFIWFFNFFISFIFGFSVFVINFSLFLTKKIILESSKNYENTSAFFKHICLNCFIGQDIFRRTEGKVIKIDEDGLIYLNPYDIFPFFQNFNHTKLFLKAVNNSFDQNISVGWLKSYENQTAHITYTYILDNIRNVSTNVTSSQTVLVKTNDVNISGFFSKLLNYGMNPNVSNMNKINYFTTPFCVDFKKIYISNINEKIRIRANQFKINAKFHLMFSGNELMLKQGAGNYFEYIDPQTTVDEYVKNSSDENLKNCMELIRLFELYNEEKLSTPEGKQIYEDFKKFLVENEFTDKTNSFINYYFDD